MKFIICLYASIFQPFMFLHTQKAMSMTQQVKSTHISALNKVLLHDGFPSSVNKDTQAQQGKH